MRERRRFGGGEKAGLGGLRRRGWTDWRRSVAQRPVRANAPNASVRRRVRTEVTGIIDFLLLTHELFCLGHIGGESAAAFYLLWAVMSANHDDLLSKVRYVIDLVPLYTVTSKYKRCAPNAHDITKIVHDLTA